MQVLSPFEASKLNSNSPMSHHCRNFRSTGTTRREMLRNTACGFGSVALAGLMADPAYAGMADDGEGNRNHGSTLASRPTHFPAKVKRVVYLYMDGGPSQIDTWDPKPLLEKEHGQPFKMKVEPTQFDNNGATMASPWKFRQYGESGIPVSDLFPHIAQHVDDFAVIRSMVSDFSEHTSANYFLHTGEWFSGSAKYGGLGFLRNGNGVRRLARVCRAQRRTHSAWRPRLL